MPEDASKNQLINQFISGLIIPSINRVQILILDGDYYGALRAEEILLGVLWNPTEEFVKKVLEKIQNVRNEANKVSNVDIESTVRDYAFTRQIIAESLSLKLYYAIMGRLLSEGFFKFVSGVLSTSIIMESGKSSVEAIPDVLQNVIK